MLQFFLVLRRKKRKQCKEGPAHIEKRTEGGEKEGWTDKFGQLRKAKLEDGKRDKGENALLHWPGTKDMSMDDWPFVVNYMHAFSSWFQVLLIFTRVLNDSTKVNQGCV